MVVFVSVFPVLVRMLHSLGSRRNKDASCTGEEGSLSGQASGHTRTRQNIATVGRRVEIPAIPKINSSWFLLQTHMAWTVLIDMKNTDLWLYLHNVSNIFVVSELKHIVSISALVELHQLRYLQGSMISFPLIPWLMCSSTHDSSEQTLPSHDCWILCECYWGWCGMVGCAETEGGYYTVWLKLISLVASSSFGRGATLAIESFYAQRRLIAEPKYQSLHDQFTIKFQLNVDACSRTRHMMMIA
jgi:hypothetical protein